MRIPPYYIPIIVNQSHLLIQDIQCFTGTSGNNFITAKQGIKVDIDSDNNQGATSFDITHGGATGTVFSASETGDISFYEDTGTTPKFFWDASAEGLGIGTTSPAHPLDVIGTIRSYVSTTGDFNFYATSDGGGAFRISPDDATTANPTWQYQSNSSEDQAWVIGGVERGALSGRFVCSADRKAFTSSMLPKRPSKSIGSGTLRPC